MNILIMTFRRHSIQYTYDKHNAYPCIKKKLEKHPSPQFPLGISFRYRRYRNVFE